MHRLSYLLLFCLLTLPISSQEKEQKKETFRIMFWNVENLFDTERDSIKQDEEFTPTGMRAWNTRRYKKKMADVARIITAVGEWEPPALVGLCEVENHKVLRYLTHYSPLKSHRYQYVMTESADLRGIDVALLYQKDKFKLLNYRAIRPDLGLSERPTRDILHVTGLVPTKDTIDVMVVHFPSRSGGEHESEYKRLITAQLLKNVVDSLFTIRHTPRVLIMGDFNDYPENKSIKEVLDVKFLEGENTVQQLNGNTNEMSSQSFKTNSLYHLLAHKATRKNKKNASVIQSIAKDPSDDRRRVLEQTSHSVRSDEGTSFGGSYGSYKYQGQWGILDHLIVSGALLNTNSSFYTSGNHADVVRLPFLLVEDERFGGQQPFRTYNGMRYQGGYSDHLPVRVDFELLIDK